MSIWNTGHDENGNYSWGEPGDQTGGESCVRSWFSSPWDAVMRYPEQALAAEAAWLAERAANNPHIGYCQAHRNTFYERLAETGTWDPADISEDCETDCARSCTTVWQAVGYRHGIEALMYLDPDPYYDTTWTHNFRERYREAGFIELTDGLYLSGDEMLMPGDCMVNSNVHAAMQLTVGDWVEDWGPGTIAETPMVSTRRTDILAGQYTCIVDRVNVRDAPYGNIFAEYTHGETVNLDGYALETGGDGEPLIVWGRYKGASGYDRYVAVMKDDVSYFEYTGEYEDAYEEPETYLIAGTYEITCDALNIRTAPSLGATVAGTYFRGETVELDGWCQVEDGYLWGRYIGTTSGKYRYVAVMSVDGSPVLMTRRS